MKEELYKINEIFLIDSSNLKENFLNLDQEPIKEKRNSNDQEPIKEKRNSNDHHFHSSDEENVYY